MSRFYVKPENIKGGFIYISGDEAHHILDVMRLKKGDGVVVFDGLGNEFEGLISETKRKSLVISIRNKKKKSLLGTKIALAQAIPKSEKMDYIVQKCTELGVHSIIPMVTERTIVKIAKSKEAKRRARWSKIATEASKQCGRSDVPEIKNISGFKDALKLSRDYNLRIMPSVVEKKQGLADLVRNQKDAIVFIGPEGGFSPAEIKLAQDNNFKLVSLGRYTLKSDTAAVVSMAILCQSLSDFLQ